MTNPILISTPFAIDGDKNTIQESNPLEPNNATWSQGWTPITSTPIINGGLAPFRKDFNGINYVFSDNLRYLASGLDYQFDAVHANKIGGYPLHAELMLENGDRVVSIIPNNTNNPNIDMTGWSYVNQKTVDSIADLLAIKNPKDGMVVFVKSYWAGWAVETPYRRPVGGGHFVYNLEKSSINNSFTIINGWVRIYDRLDVYMGGAKGDDVQDDTPFIQNCQDVIADTRWKGSYTETEKNVGFGRELHFLSGKYKTTKPLLIAAGTTWIFEGNAQQINYNRLTGDRAVLVPDFDDPYDWVIKTNNYNVSTGELIPYDKFITGYEFDGGGTGQRLFSFCFGVQIKNIAIMAKKQMYGGIKLCCAQGSNIENFSITNTDYGVASSCTFTAKFTGSTMHHKCGLVMGNENNQTYFDGYFNRYDKSGNTLPLPNGTNLTNIATATQSIGVWVAPMQTCRFGSVTCEHNDYGLVATWTQLTGDALYTENSKIEGMYLNNARLNVGIWGGVGDIHYGNIAYGSTLNIDLFNKIDFSSTNLTYKPFSVSGTNNIITVENGLEYWDANVIYSSINENIFYVDAANGNDAWHGLTPKRPCKTLNVALNRINNAQKNLVSKQARFKVCLMTSDVYNTGAVSLSNIWLEFCNYSTNTPTLSNNQSEVLIRDCDISFRGVNIETPATEGASRIFRANGETRITLINSLVKLNQFKQFVLFEYGFLKLNLDRSNVTATSTTSCFLVENNIDNQFIDVMNMQSVFDANSIAQNYGIKWVAVGNIKKNF